MASTEVTARCQHCGFELSPTHEGPCPNCGKVGKVVSARVFATIGIQAAVNTSAQRVFALHSTPFPDWWPEAEKAITVEVTRAIENKLPDILQQHDREQEAREKRPMSVVKKVFWFIVASLASFLLGVILSHYGIG
jgi:hypothetical protein